MYLDFTFVISKSCSEMHFAYKSVFCCEGNMLIYCISFNTSSRFGKNFFGVASIYFSCFL